MDTHFPTPFRTKYRDQLNRMLGSAGFRARPAILRHHSESLAHGYAFTPTPLFDPNLERGRKTWDSARKRVGRNAIANS